MNNRITPLASCLLAISLVTACSDGGHSSHDDTPAPAQEHKLRRVGNASELETYLKNGLREATNANGTIDNLDVVSNPSPPTDSAAGGGGPAAVPTFSATTLIEEGVDEADIIKSDGDLVFVAAPTSFGCNEICIQQASDAGIAVGEPDPTAIQNRVRVMRANDTTHSTTEIAQINIPHSAEHDLQSVSGLILAEENSEKTLVAITSASSNIYQNTNPLEPNQWSSIWAWSYGSTIIDTFDVSNTASISHDHRIELDGYLLQTRRIENTLYVVTRFTPEIVIGGTNAERKAKIDALSLNEMLPQVSIDGQSNTLVSPDNCFVDTEATGYPTLMVVTAIDLGDYSLQSSCVTANMYGFYMSKQSLYLTQAEWTENSDEFTHIYKFSLSQDGPAYRGEGSVEGSPTANYDFTISEHDDVLRIATTTRDASWMPTNLLHTLAENAQGDLEKLATLPNQQHPESIGKPGETIQGIRFVGDRAYVVTFLQTDPLYVVDLSDPTNPFLAGEVEIPGFSTLLQPLANDLLLGVGRENNSLKVELYDVADPSAPQSVNKYVMDDAANDAVSSSSAAWNHHALALLPSQDSVRLAIPFYRYKYGDRFEEAEGAISFSVDLLNRSMTLAGRADATSDAYTYGQPRVLLQPNTLHYIQDAKVWSGAWGSNAPLTNPQ